MDYVHSTSKDTKVKEMNYKLTKWYYVPSKMHKINSDTSSLCWRECGEEGNHAHIWWQCRVIQTYWVEVLRLIKQIEGKGIELDPWKCLFHAMEGQRKDYRTSLTPFLLNAAKALIPRNWRNKDPPKVREWFSEVDKIRVMEELISHQEEVEIKFQETWGKWIHFKQSQSYLRIMGSEENI